MKPTQTNIHNQTAQQFFFKFYVLAVAQIYKMMQNFIDVDLNFNIKACKDKLNKICSKAEM